MKARVFGFLAWLVLAGRVYYFWSKIYQSIFERRFRNAIVPEFKNIEALSIVVGSMRWRRDGFMQLWDAVSHPKATWVRHFRGNPAGDCDDVSFFAVDAIQSMMHRGLLSRVKSVGLLSCPWIELNGGKVGGHNVCAVEYLRRDIETDSMVLEWAHLSNWNDGRIVAGFATLEDVVRDVVGGRDSLYWALADHELRVKEHGRLSD